MGVSVFSSRRCRGGWTGCAAVFSLALLAADARGQSRAALGAVEASARAAAAEQAGARGDRAAIPKLLDLLQDDQVGVRLAAVSALVKLRAKRASRPLMVLAQSDPDAGVRAAAARGVKQLDLRGYVAKLATADKPPVLRPKQLHLSPQRLWRVGRALMVSAGVAFNARRAGESAVGVVGAGLRWPRAEFQLSLSYPALSLFGQMRLNLLKKSVIVPYMHWGFAIAFNNGEQRPNGPSASLFAGLGLRFQPVARFYFFGEAAANWVISQPSPPVIISAAATNKQALPKMTVPVIAGVGMEFWP